MKLNRKGVIGLAAAALVALGGGTAAFAASSDPAAVPNGITATEAYSDSISNITALFGPSGTEIVGNPGSQVPDSDIIQFGATSTLNPIAISVFSWSDPVAPTAPISFDASTGKLALGGSVVSPTGENFTIDATERVGLTIVAQGVANVAVTPGSISGDDTVTVTLDLLNLQAPTNNGTSVTFNAVDTGGTNVTETMADLPAGVTFSGNVLSVGTAVQGHYPLMIDTATDAQGAVANEGFTAVVGPFFQGVPVLYGGHAQEITPNREEVFFGQRNAASWDMFTIVGPGKINGHQGWVNGQIGENIAYYSGLEGHHGYTVNYTPVEGQGSTVPVPGSHFGYVYFVS